MLSGVKRPAPPTDRLRLEVWCDTFPVLSETFVAAEAQELRRTGTAVRVLAGARPAVRGPLPDGLPVAYLEDDPTVLRVLALALVAFRHPFGCLADLVARRRWRREEEVPPLRYLAPAIVRLARVPATRVHVHFAGGAALNALRVSRILGRPWSLTAHAHDIYRTPRNLREKLRAAAVVTSGCDYTVRDLRRIAGEDRAARVHRVVMGVDPDRFRRRTPHPDERHVVAVGRLVEKKGFLHLLAAAAEPELAAVLDRVTIAGDGPLRAELAAEVARLGLGAKVTLTGALEPDAVRELLEGAAVLAMPCVVAADGDRDSMPVVVKEALAMEVPVVVSDEVGLRELARPAFARLVPPGDPGALARALAELLARTPEERARMGGAGRAFAGEHANLAVETARLRALLGTLE
jgi:colanic acid/amylovoran biosynthesis glycosyltransferase